MKTWLRTRFWLCLGTSSVYFFDHLRRPNFCFSNTNLCLIQDQLQLKLTLGALGDFWIRLILRFHLSWSCHFPRLLGFQPEMWLINLFASMMRKPVVKASSLYFQICFDGLLVWQYFLVNWFDCWTGDVNAVRQLSIVLACQGHERRNHLWLNSYQSTSPGALLSLARLQSKHLNFAFSESHFAQVNSSDFKDLRRPALTRPNFLAEMHQG